MVYKIILILKTSDKCFSNFVISQCKEAFILGFLCMLGMLIICPKYAIMIGVLIGITAFIPILGAYIGASVGAFVVFTEQPIKALYFIIFIIVLQQIEGNLIYPKVVGTTVGFHYRWWSCRYSWNVLGSSYNGCFVSIFPRVYK